MENIFSVNPLSANPEKWSNTLKQIVGNLPTICLSVFDHFMNLALKGLRRDVQVTELSEEGRDSVKGEDLCRENKV